MGIETTGPFKAPFDDCVGVEAEATVPVLLNSVLDLVTGEDDEGGMVMVENPELTGLAEVEVGTLIVRGGRDVERVPTVIVDKGASDSVNDDPASDDGMGI